MARPRGVPNRPFPAMPLEKALELAETLQNKASGMTTDRLTLSQLLDKSPSSSLFQKLILASRAYGLTTGGKNALEFGLTDVGRKVTSDDPVERKEGLTQAVMNIAPFASFLREYDKKKVPQAAAFKAYLTNQASVPADHVDEAMTQIIESARVAGLLRSVKGAEYVDLQGTAVTMPPLPKPEDAPLEGDESDDELEDVLRAEVTAPIVAKPSAANPRVFITHGKNAAIVQQLKELLTFGKFEAVVAQEHETVSKPVPEKVMEEMRSCDAAVIHVATEEQLIDQSGNERIVINENVLIEIGAAMALYGRNFILLVPHGLKLPSNLQGLYRVDYEGANLDYDATMKLLKAFSDFRPGP